MCPLVFFLCHQINWPMCARFPDSILRNKWFVMEQQQLRKQLVLVRAHSIPSGVSQFLTSNFGMLGIFGMRRAVGTRIPLNLSSAVQRIEQTFHNIQSQRVQVANEQYVGAEDGGKDAHQKPAQQPRH